MRLQRRIEFAYLKKAGSSEPAKSWNEGLFRLERDVTIRAMDDNTVSLIKFPTVVCHAFDSCFVLAGEGYIRKIVATSKHRLPDASHAV